MIRKLIAVAAVALALTGCTTKVIQPQATLGPAIVVTTPPTEVTAAATVARESAALSSLITRTTTDAQNLDTQAVIADCGQLRTSSAQWNADLTQFDTEYPGALAAQGVDPVSAQASVTSLLASCSLLGG